MNVATLRREVERLEAERRDQLVPVAGRPVDFARSVGVSLVLAQDRDRFAREPAYLYLLRREFEEQGKRYVPSTTGEMRAQRASLQTAS